MSGQRGNGDPFSPFGGDLFAGFGGFGGHRSLASSFFGGRNPFDDPFFTRPFGGMSGPMMNADPFNMGSNMMNSHQSGFSAHGPLMNAHQSPGAYRSNGPIIEELNSDDEVVEDEEKNHAPKKPCRSTEGSSEVEGRRGKQLQCGNNFNTMNNMQTNSRSQSFTFQSSSVTYGGSDGSYSTKSRSMRTGSDGLTVDETKEADSTTGRASHRLSRGIYDKGHTVSRNLQSDGRVDTKQILHNINEDELVNFEEAWKENAGRHLPGWSEGLRVQNGPGCSAQTDQQHSRGGWALPSTEGDGAGSSQIQHTATGRARKKVGDAKRSARRRSGGN
ncbi:Myeloid leukemia factor 1 [Heracleum sosnowskyi]|uniref:Myeloid leukemia factor 1 n=1 Tax=Heracleum sosnowskyi TaxID=360622 RepID=A0AAD8HZN1_9APIA|nr:Myeloid leukemia factor 1 [Heracleum sosnowskyi]